MTKKTNNILYKRDIAICKFLIKFIENDKNISKHFNFTFTTQKHKLCDTIPLIILILRDNLPWARSSFYFNIPPSTLYSIFKKLCFFNIFFNSYKSILMKCLPKICNKNKNFRLTDTSSIINKQGKQVATRNTLYNNKKMIKISLISFANGIPYNVKVETGKVHDSTILLNQLQSKNIIECKTGTTPIYFLADKGYDSETIRNELIKQNMIPIIDHNNRNRKDINKKKLTKNEKKIYNKRIKIENIFSRIKNSYRRLDKLYESKIKTYENFLYLALSIILNERSI